MKFEKNLWWGYLHSNKSVQVKRFFSEEDLKEADRSPFCVKVIYPFEANSREEAIKYIKEHYLEVEALNYKID